MGGFSRDYAENELCNWTCLKCNENIEYKCICGKSHSSNIHNTFSIACDSCDVWYRVLPKCIGFDVKQAQTIETWYCKECDQNKCICGKIHSENNNDIFSILCDSCNNWFRVLPKCVGFDVKQAQTIETWTCRECDQNKCICGRIHSENDNDLF